MGTGLVLMEVTHPMVLAAFREQEAQRVAEFDGPRPALYALQQIAPPELLALTRELRRSEDVRERELAAWVIGQSPLPKTTIADEVRDALKVEEESRGHLPAYLGLGLRARRGHAP